MWNRVLSVGILLLLAVLAPRPCLGDFFEIRDKPRCKGTKKWHDGKCRYPEEITRLRKQKKQRPGRRRNQSTSKRKRKRNGKTSGMVLMKGGKFEIGCQGRTDEDCQLSEQPRHALELGTFWIDKTEVTVRDYRKCVAAKICSEPVTPAAMGDCNWAHEGRSEHPVNCVDWEQARTFCEWREARLPTEAEWERAASGASELKYPWKGNAAHCIFAVMQHGGHGCAKERTWPVCSKPKGMTADGLCDVAGNVSEWVQDWYDDNFYVNTGTRNPLNATPSASKSRRGGSWIDGGELLRVSSRQRSAASARLTFVGFRCAANAE